MEVVEAVEVVEVVVSSREFEPYYLILHSSFRCTSHNLHDCKATIGISG